MIDSAGRVVIPKPVRDRLRLQPGDALELESDGDTLRLSPKRPKAVLCKEDGIWVYCGDSTGIDIVSAIERDRETRGRDTGR